MEIEFLKNNWLNIWDNNPDTKQVESHLEKIFIAYSAKGRYYHNLEHIQMMISAAQKHSVLIDDLKTLQLAIFYHDYVYSVKSKTNEEESALMAELSLRKLNYPNILIDKCKKFIQATKNHNNSLNYNDLNYLLDFDLEKLGCTWDAYFEYTQQIRKEYNIFPDILYKLGRKKVLTNFLNLENIYKTDLYKEKYEKTARQNLLKELESL
jgi:predicted metal-dependent HD superfamily phosphohydrolase